MKNFNRILVLIIVILIMVLLGMFCDLIWSTNNVSASFMKYRRNNVINQSYDGMQDQDIIYVKVENEEAQVSSHNYLSTTPVKVEETKVPSQTVIKQEKYSDEWIAEFNKNIEILKKEYPDGYYWNHPNGTNSITSVTTTPCNHKKGICYCNVYDSKSTRACGFKVGRQCAGFASMLSDRIFGKDANVKIFYNYDDIRVGDQARIDNNGHTVFIIDKTDDYVVVAECNADYRTCVIRWGRKIPRNKLKGYYLTRY